MYVIRCVSGSFTVAFGWRGALAVLRDCGKDAAIFTLFGRWVGGRVVAA